jgi:ubiquinol-cytochrome c reductase cytochrome b subunit
MNALFRWIEDRTGLFTVIGATVGRPLPGAPSLRYVIPSALAFGCVVQALTGLVLWMYYSPGAQTAWESVYWIQEGLHGGWLLRGIHFYTANVMAVLALLYVVQLVLSGLYRAPREIIFWLALGMVGAVLGLMLTGDLLRWDQEGYWSTQVRVSFLMLLPEIGAHLFKVAAGGPAFGHLTLTRFFALHVGVMAVALFALLAAHWWLIGRHGLKNQPADTKPRSYWPGQATINTLGWLVMIGVVAWLLARPALQGAHPGQLRGQYLGAPLGAPADPAEAYAAARPEWAFLALYEFSNLFPGELKIIPIFVVTSFVALLLVLMPFIGRWTVGHVFNVLLLLGLGVGAVGLSFWGIDQDRKNAGHQAALAAGHEEALRARELAKGPAGIPVTGALTLVRSDPKLQGPRLFEQHCASCHAWVDPQGKGMKPEKPSAPNLYHFADRAWIAGLMDPKRIASPEYFGGTAFRKGEMAGFVKDTFSDLGDDEKKQLAAAVAALSAEAGLKSQRDLDKADAALIATGRKAMTGEYDCANCHKLLEKGRLGSAPDLTGYGSREWLIGIISNPAHKRFYGEKNDRMPRYAESPEPEKNILSPKAVGIIADWLRGEWQ